MPENKMQNKIIYDRAKAAALSRDYALASRLYKGLLSSEPENIEFLLGLGDVYERSGQDANAIPLYREVVRLQPTNVDAFNKLAGVYRRLKRYDDSISMLEQALITDESNVQVYYNLGFTYKLMGKYEDAVQCFTRVIDENPSDVLTYNHLGSIYDAQQDYTKAIAAYQRGLKVDPNHPILHLNLAHAYESTGQIEFAEKEYEAALRSKPGWLDAIDGYAGLLLKKDDAKNAGALVQQAIRLNPQNVKLHTSMGDVYAGQQLFDAAEDEYREALKYDENYAAALSGLANAYESSGKKADALRTMQRLEKIQPESEHVQQEYSAHLLSANKLNAASKKIKQLWDRNSEDVRTLNLLAQYYICKGEDKKAQGCFKKIEVIDPTYTVHLRDAGDRYHQKGRYKKAESMYLKYLESNVNESSSLMKLARNYEKLGLFDKALAYYQMLYARDESNPVYSAAVNRVSALSTGSALPQDEKASEEVEAEDEIIEEAAESEESEETLADEDIAPDFDEEAEDDAELPEDTFAELADDNTDAEEVLDSDALDSLDEEDPKGVDLDDLISDDDSDEDDDFFKDNPFGASDTGLPTKEEDMDDMFLPEDIEEEEEPAFESVPEPQIPKKPEPKKPAPKPPVKTKPEPEPELEDEDIGDEDFSLDDLEAEPAVDEADEELSLDDLEAEPAVEEDEADEELSLDNLEAEPAVEEDEADEELSLDDLEAEPAVEEDEADEELSLDNLEAEPAVDEDEADEELNLDNLEAEPATDEDEADEELNLDDLEAEPATDEDEADEELSLDDLEAEPAEDELDDLVINPEDEEAVAEEEPAEETVVEEEPVEEEPAEESVAEEEPTEEPVVEEEPTEEPVVEEEPAEEPVVEEAARVDDSALYEQTVAREKTLTEVTWSEEKISQTLQLLQELKNLIEYLPGDKKAEFAGSKVHLLLDYLIARLSGKQGLLAHSTQVRKDLGVNSSALPSDAGAGLVKNVVSGMEEYVASLPDEDLASVLEQELFGVMQKLERDDS